MTEDKPERATDSSAQARRAAPLPKFDPRKYFGVVKASRKAIDDDLANDREAWESRVYPRTDDEGERPMEAIRQIQTVENGEIHLRLPEQFWGQEVEIIVLGSSNAAARPGARKTSLRGSLREYARPERIPEEQHAWQNAASDKHEPG